MADMDLGGSVEAFGGDRGGQQGAATGTGPSDGGGSAASGGPAGGSGVDRAAADFGPSQFTAADASSIARSLVGPAFLGIALVTQPAATIAMAPGVGQLSLTSTAAAMSAIAAAPSPGELGEAFAHAAHDVIASMAATAYSVDPRDLAIQVATGEPINLGYGADGNLTPDGVVGVRPSQPVDSGWSGGGFGGSEGGFA